MAHQRCASRSLAPRGVTAAAFAVAEALNSSAQEPCCLPSTTERVAVIAPRVQACPARMKCESPGRAFTPSLGRDGRAAGGASAVSTPDWYSGLLVSQTVKPPQLPLSWASTLHEKVSTTVMHPGASCASTDMCAESVGVRDGEAPRIVDEDDGRDEEGGPGVLLQHPRDVSRIVHVADGEGAWFGAVERVRHGEAPRIIDEDDGRDEEGGPGVLLQHRCDVRRIVRVADGERAAVAGVLGGDIAAVGVRDGEAPRVVDEDDGVELEGGENEVQHRDEELRGKK
eukprot:CAMPEP_0180219872 /NCGR_PEP_ID=MMETSP0987-20121128/18771_1 /TAXON_ID=697907 /ORGANISM="non described non described, Strain CCMP2293" /LENGTH=283 /DNA_ID=CAMNT_0022180647 /DNA_START=473 /DNA_END=1321 /DNA_ORIENTATION=-